MQTHVAYACFTNESVVVSYNVAELDANVLMATLNAVNTNASELDDSLIRQFLERRRSSYRFCEGYDWQSLTAVGNTKELALQELKKNMNEWLQRWVDNYYDVGKQVIEYIDTHEPSTYTDITEHVNLIQLG